MSRQLEACPHCQTHFAKDDSEAEKQNATKQLNIGSYHVCSISDAVFGFMHQRLQKDTATI